LVILNGHLGRSRQSATITADHESNMRRECFATACSDSCTVGVIEVRNSDDMLITCDIIIGLQLERDSATYYM